MRRIILIMAAVAALTSCIRAGQIKEAGIQTDAFLTAYCSGNYDAAATLCTEPLKSRILKSAELTAGLDSSVTSITGSILKEIVWKKDAVETEKETDEIIFTCSTSYNGQSRSYTVTLTPAEKGWVISDID